MRLTIIILYITFLFLYYAVFYRNYSKQRHIVSFLRLSTLKIPNDIKTITVYFLKMTLILLLKISENIISFSTGLVQDSFFFAKVVLCINKSKPNFA